MSLLRFFTAEDPDMAWVRAIRQQVFVQDLGVPEQQEFDAADLPGADTVYALLTAEGSPLGTGRLQGAAENYKIGRIAFLSAARGERPPTGNGAGAPCRRTGRAPCAGGRSAGGCGFL